jgi:hypothetical protein
MNRPACRISLWHASAFAELDHDLRSRLRAPAQVQRHAQDAVDAEPGVPEAGVGVWSHVAWPKLTRADRRSLRLLLSGGLGVHPPQMKSAWTKMSVRATNHLVAINGCLAAPRSAHQVRR